MKVRRANGAVFWCEVWQGSMYPSWLYLPLSLTPSPSSLSQRKSCQTVSWRWAIHSVVWWPCCLYGWLASLMVSSVMVVVVVGLTRGGDNRIYLRHSTGWHDFTRLWPTNELHHISTHLHLLWLITIVNRHRNIYGRGSLVIYTQNISLWVSCDDMSTQNDRFMSKRYTYILEAPNAESDGPKRLHLNYGFVWLGAELRGPLTAQRPVDYSQFTIVCGSRQIHTQRHLLLSSVSLYGWYDSSEAKLRRMQFPIRIVANVMALYVCVTRKWCGQEKTRTPFSIMVCVLVVICHKRNDARWRR